MSTFLSSEKTVAGASAPAEPAPADDTGLAQPASADTILAPPTPADTSLTTTATKSMLASLSDDPGDETAVESSTYHKAGAPGSPPLTPERAKMGGGNIGGVVGDGSVVSSEGRARTSSERAGVSPRAGGAYPPSSPSAAAYPPSSPSAASASGAVSGAGATQQSPPSAFRRTSGLLDFLHSAGAKRSSVYDVERDSAVVEDAPPIDDEAEERARATALRAGMNSRLRREWDELEREERELEMERRRLEAEEEGRDGPKPAVAASGLVRGSKMKHPMSSIPRSSYYTGPPAMGSAFGTSPVGQIGVHFPREIIRVERDYSGGELCQFYPSFLMELEGRVTPTEFMETINSINEILVSAHSLNASFWDNLLSIVTLFTWSLVFRSHYDKEMQRLQDAIQEWNRRVYNPRGLNIVWPRKSAFLFLEIEYY